MKNTGRNLAWERKERALLGTQLAIPTDATIDTVCLPDGRWIRSPYKENNPANAIVNSEEAQQYIGQVGVILRLSFQERHIQMNDGAVVVLIVSEVDGNNTQAQK